MKITESTKYEGKNDVVLELDDIKNNAYFADMIDEEIRDSIAEVILPEGLATIPIYYFRICAQLKSIIVPSSIEKIGAATFYGSGIETIALPETLKAIGNSAFASSSIKRIIIPKGIKKLDISTFDNSKLEEIILPDGLELIGAECFRNCIYLKTIELPSTVKKLEYQAFFESALERIELPEGIERIPRGCFGACKRLKTAKLPSSIKALESSAFAGSGLERIELSEGLERIESSCFYECRLLKAINIPKSVKKIGDHAFDLTGLKKITLHTGLQELSPEAFCETCVENIVFEYENYDELKELIKLFMKSQKQRLIKDKKYKKKPIQYTIKGSKLSFLQKANMTRLLGGNVEFVYNKTITIEKDPIGKEIEKTLAQIENLISNLPESAANIIRNKLKEYNRDYNDAIEEAEERFNNSRLDQVVPNIVFDTKMIKMDYLSKLNDLYIDLYSEQAFLKTVQGINGYIELLEGKQSEEKLKEDE